MADNTAYLDWLAWASGRSAGLDGSGPDKDFADTEQLMAWLAEGVGLLSQRQKLYIDAYYNQGLSMHRIGELYGVDSSTVSRGVARGMSCLRKWLEDKRLVAGCTLDDGSIRWSRLLRELHILTERERQLMGMAGQNITHNELAAQLHLHRATVSHILRKGADKLIRLGIPVKRLKWLGLWGLN